MLQRDVQSESRWPSLGHLILAAGTAIALIAAPITIEPDSLAITWQAALGKDHGGGSGNGGRGGDGPGNGHGRDGAQGVANRGLGPDHAPGRNGHGPKDDGSGFRDLAEFRDQLFGRQRADERVEHAKQRYEDALGRRDRAREGHQGDARAAHRFSAEETRELIARGWRARHAGDDGFENHGQRVRTMVELAKRLGYGARVGALQANFGTPYEIGIAELEAELAEARAAAEAGDAEAAQRVAELEEELDEAVRNAKPGRDNDDWARADLDVNDDGVVDQRDLEALDAETDTETSATGSTDPAAT